MDMGRAWRRRGEERSNSCKLLLGNPEVKRLFGRIGTYWRVILKCMLQK